MLKTLFQTSLVFFGISEVPACDATSALCSQNNWREPQPQRHMCTNLCRRAYKSLQLCESWSLGRLSHKVLYRFLTHLILICLNLLYTIGTLNTQLRLAGSIGSLAGSSGQSAILDLRSTSTLRHHIHTLIVWARRRAAGRNCLPVEELARTPCPCGRARDQEQ